jgi:hypothetical protein
MPTALKLDHRKPITYESALQKTKQHTLRQRRSSIGRSGTRDKTFKFLHHLRFGIQDTCIVEAQDQWIRGSFNVCIPVEVRSIRFYKKLIFRCPMPYKLAEAKYPGTVNEKLSSEVGTYV